MKRILNIFCLTMLLICLSSCKDISHIPINAKMFMDENNVQQPDKKADNVSDNGLESGDEMSVFDVPPKNAIEIPWERIGREAINGRENRVMYIPSFLDEEQQILYKMAEDAYRQLTIHNEGFGSDESGEHIEIDNRTYIQANGLYTKWDDFERAMLQLFTAEYLKQLLSPYRYTDSLGQEHFIHQFVQHEENLYYSYGARGGNITFIRIDKFELVEQTEEIIRFDVVGLYFDEYSPTLDGSTHTVARPLEMVNTADGWRFSLFNVPY